MDPFSITAGAVGITSFALSSIDQLRKTIDSLAEAQDVFQDITSNLEAIQRPLIALQESRFPDGLSCTAAKEDLEKTGMAEAVNKCGQACSDFNVQLGKWTKHSTNTKLTLRDRLSVGVWNKEKICTFRTRVQTCQSIVQFSIESTQLLVQLHSASASDAYGEELNKRLQALENNLQQHINLTKTLCDEAQKRKEQLSKEPEEEEDDGGAQRKLAIQEVEEQSRLLEAEASLANAISSRLLAERSSQASGNTYSGTISGTNQNGMQVVNNPGVINWTSK
ncbi:hypothetical protein yc1106_08070 [Curvularia clavata]|uniref:Azaphilone pigments biosynthesis cluster protein L N-terminal domain-containing protein n=1 Tax=Curvularia clavata TaxID=95742 RepID=A0A9Q9DWS7_CURCL|nr:hypothetical protein yc1106_08070 [Curvularia clavata]